MAAVSLWPLGGEFRAQSAHGGVDQESNIADGEFGDTGDFLVAESVLELEPHDLLLVRRQAIDEFEDRRTGLGALEFAPRMVVLGGEAFHLAILKSLHP